MLKVVGRYQVNDTGLGWGERVFIAVALAVKLALIYLIFG